MDLRQLRPVGHKFYPKKQPLNPDCFAPFHFLGFGSGTQALAAALIGARRRFNGDENSEVLIPAYTCPDIISACAFAGVKARLVDLKPNSCQMDLDDLNSKKNTKTLAVVAINFLGIPEDIDAIRQIVGEITVIEDSAQGLNGQDANGYWKGDLVILSFGRGKPLNLMRGGALLINDSTWNKYLPEMSARTSTVKERLKYWLMCQIFRVCSLPTIYYWLTRLPGVDLGATRYKKLEQLEPLPDYVQERIEDALSQYRSVMINWTNYQTLLQNNPSVRLITDEEAVQNESMLLRFPVLLTQPERVKQLKEKLHNCGVSTLYKRILPEINMVPENVICNAKEDLSHARRFAECLITLPCFNDISLQDQRMIVNTLERFSL